MDELDRRLLGLLAEDAGRPYAELGREVGLSPPAVHERVKKLRRQGVITGSTVTLDAKQLGRPVLAFVHVDTAGWGKGPELLALADRPEFEEIHSVAGDACLLLKVRCAGPRALEALLADIYRLPGVKATRTYIALNTYLERGARP